ncbi:MAG: chorismate-binding protein [Porphyromonas sp.]|nr:chorismate-binding protein [Porphyromonas sp.]
MWLSDQKQIETLLWDAQSGSDAVALFRYPNETILHIVRCREENVISFSDISQIEIPAEGAFVFAPYAPSESNPLFLLPLKEKTEIPYIPNITTEEKQSFTAEKYGSLSEYESYSILFRKFHQAVSEGTFDKLVLTRNHTEKGGQSHSPASLLVKMLNSYPDAFVALTYLPHEGFWLTASPELLLSGAGQAWKTVSLAGTRLEGSLENWSDKNRNEQRMVTGFISDTLQKLGCNVLQQAVEVHKAGQIEHLKTEITFTSPTNISAQTLLAQLHPTPAVCGFPRVEAQHFIEETEDHPRKFYSGFLGFLASGEGETRIYVNLRCAHFQGEQYTLYAGGGIMPESELQSEWEESCFKMHTIGALI